MKAVTENQPYLRERESLRTSNLVNGWSTMTRITHMRGECDLQAESSEWLFKSPLAGGGGILWRSYYRHAACFAREKISVTFFSLSLHLFSGLGPSDAGSG